MMPALFDDDIDAAKAFFRFVEKCGDFRRNGSIDAGFVRGSAAVTSPTGAFVNKPDPFPNSYRSPFC